jgi:L-2-hydroxycarboxylate dehydrogenase (NAD+)
MIVPVEVARRAASAALLAAHVDAAGTALQVDLLVDADLAGRASHGLMRLPRIIERIRNGVTDPATRGRQHWRRGLLHVDGCNGLGPVVACAALDALAFRAAEQGIAAATIRRSNHLGMLGWYAGRVARAGQD